MLWTQNKGDVFFTFKELKVYVETQKLIYSNVYNIRVDDDGGDDDK